jgi:hypothetical protein
MNYVTTSGPLFDGRAAIILKEATDAIGQQVAEEGLDLIQSDLARVIRTHPTGRYIPSVKVVRRGSGSFTVGTDIVYGAWIEGTGSRNATTRFKGYSTFRRQRQVLEARAGVIGNRVIKPYVGRLNG